MASAPQPSRALRGFVCQDLATEVGVQFCYCSFRQSIEQVKKAPLLTALQFFCSKIGDKEVGFHIKWEPSSRTAILPPCHQCSPSGFPAAEGREQPQHLSCHTLLCHQPGWLKTSPRNFSFWKQFCLQSCLLNTHTVHHTSMVHSSHR